jgi:hypothetical protein
MTRNPDPATDNIVLNKIISVYSRKEYDSELTECPLTDLLKYDYISDNKKIEVKYRHFAPNMTYEKIYFNKDILVEISQHEGCFDGWRNECEADRIWFIKVLYNTSINPFTVKVDQIKEFTIIDCDWNELKELSHNMSYNTVYSGKTTGSTNVIIPYEDITSKKIYRIQLKGD